MAELLSRTLAKWLIGRHQLSADDLDSIRDQIFDGHYTVMKDFSSMLERIKKDTNKITQGALKNDLLTIILARPQIDSSTIMLRKITEHALPDFPSSIPPYIDDDNSTDDTESTLVEQGFLLFCSLKFDENIAKEEVSVIGRALGTWDALSARVLELVMSRLHNPSANGSILEQFGTGFSFSEPNQIRALRCASKIKRNESRAFCKVFLNHIESITQADGQIHYAEAWLLRVLRQEWTDIIHD